MSLRFPMYVDLERKKILVIGAGKVAARRIRTLLLFGADITVIAREIPEEMRQEMEMLVQREKIHLRLAAVKPEDITDTYFFVLGAVNEPETDAVIEQRCRDLGIPVNIASDRNRSDFYFPAVICTRDQVIAVAGDGADHRKTARMASELRAWVSDKGDRI